MRFQSSRFSDRSFSHASLRPRLLRIEPLEDRRLLAGRAAEAVNLFAIDVYEQLQREEGNLFFSPLSISAALAMTYAGAAGQTAAEMEQVLHLGTEPGIHDSFGALFSSFDTQMATVADYEIALANAIWPQLGLPLNQDFVNTIETDYRGYAQGLDFANPELAEDIINAWIETQTHGRIQDLVDGLGPDTAMVLTNTIYFKALWDRPFDPRYTGTSSFFRAPGDEIQTPIMFTQPNGIRTQIDGFDILDLPLADGTSSIIFILPLEQNGANYLTSEFFASMGEWFDGPRYLEHLEVSLPKFQITVDTKLNQLLIGMGMSTAFESGAADFSAMTNAGVFIDKVFHKAFIEVNEQGTEAAAATEVELAICFAGGTPVLTPEGEKPIQSLQVGDLVLARDEHNLEGELEPKVIEEVRDGHANILELHVGGRVIRTTELHPFFVRGRGWMPAGKLQAKDRLSTNLGDWLEVDNVVKTGSAESVYNIRVADHHTYFVGSKAWGFAVWTHNFYDTGFYADHPFHFLIRDNATSTITFMGRIDDPSQISNSLNPTFELDTSDFGDYNNDQIVNDDDYNAWKAAFGQMGSGLPEDGNDNGRVDVADFVRWRDNLGKSFAPPSTAASSQNGPLESISERSATGNLPSTSTADPVVTPFSSSQPQRVTGNEGRLPLASPPIQVANDDLLLLADLTFTPLPSAESVSSISISEADDYETSVDEAFAEVGIELDVWKQVAL